MSCFDINHIKLKKQRHKHYNIAVSLQAFNFETAKTVVYKNCLRRIQHVIAKKVQKTAA